MKNTLFVCVLVFLAALLGWQLGRIHKSDEESDSITSMTAGDVDNMILDEISENIVGIPLNLSEIDIIDFHDNHLTLAEVANKCSSRVAQFSAMGCPPCIEHLMEDLKNYGERYPEAQIIVIVGHTNSRDLNVYEARNNRRFKFYSAENFPLSINDGRSPSYFDIDSAGVVTGHYIYRNI